MQIPFSKVTIISFGVSSLIAIPLAIKFPREQIQRVICFNGIMALDFSMKQSLLQLIHSLSRMDVTLSRFQAIFKIHCSHFQQKSQYFQSVEDRKLESTSEDQDSKTAKQQKQIECRNILRFLTIKDYIQKIKQKLVILQNSQLQFSNRNISDQIQKATQVVKRKSQSELLASLGSVATEGPLVMKIENKRLTQHPIEIKEIIEKIEENF